MTIFERIDSEREKKGWTRTQLASAADMTPQYLSRLMNPDSRDSRNFGIDSLQKLAKALNVTISYLVGEVGDGVLVRATISAATVTKPK
jgi:transcriptional regulator with XRE-family HTH domain